MKRIDVIGPAAVGKSTLCNKLNHYSKGKRYWLSEEEALALALNKAISKNSKNSIHCCFWKLVSKTPFKRKSIQKYLRARLQGNELKDYIKRHEHFFSVAKECLCTQSLIDLRFINYFKVFLKNIENIAFLHRWLPEQYVLFDESLSHKLFALIPWDKKHIALAETYCLAIPEPTAVIYLRGTSELITQNIIKRQNDRHRTTLAHRDKNINELNAINKHCLELTDCCYRTLRGRKIKSIKIESQNLEASTEEADNFLQSIKH